jgi:diguanylate cyclase (GGDEF)-like protein
MTMIKTLNEKALLETAGPVERSVLAHRLSRNNLAISVVLGWLTLPIFCLMLVLDYNRMQTGKFDQSALYLALAVMHMTLGLSVLPALAIWWRQRRSPEAVPIHWLRLHIGLFSASLLLMGMLGILERGSLVVTALALISVNLVFFVPLNWRRGFNSMAAMGSLILVISLMQEDLTRTLVLGLELLSLVVTASFSGGLLNRQRVQALLTEHQLAQLAHVDALTGLASRRRVEEFLQQEIAHLAEGRVLSLIILDIDHFKQVNDTFGHNTGDEVLRGVARLMQQRVRLEDLIGRWGGEEFLVICVDSPLAAAVDLAERLRERLLQHSFAEVGTKTASFGVASAAPNDTPQSLVERADRALYLAKQSGRNQVCASAA